MILDQLLRLRDGGTNPEVDAAETGWATLTRDPLTGAVIVAINKTPVLRGLAVVVVHPKDTNDDNSTDNLVVTIEAANELAFNVTQEDICIFPAIVHDCAANLIVRRVHTQKKYIRSKIAWADGDADVAFLDIFVGGMIPEED